MNDLTLDCLRLIFSLVIPKVVCGLKIGSEASISSEFITPEASIKWYLLLSKSKLVIGFENSKIYKM